MPDANDGQGQKESVKNKKAQNDATFTVLPEERM
jgi:hypothetical protein